MSDADARKRLTEIADSFNNHDVQGVLAGFADDAVYRPPGVGSWDAAFRGTGALTERFGGWFQSFPDCVWRQEDMVVGPQAGVMRWTMEVSDPQGRRQQIPGLDWFDLRDGLVTRKDTFIKVIPDAEFLWRPKSS